MSRTPEQYDDGVGGIGPTPRPQTSTDEAPLYGTELVGLAPGSGRCPECGAVVAPPALSCPDDGTQLEPVD